MSRYFSITGLLICVSLSAGAAAPPSTTQSSDSGMDDAHISAAALLGFGISLSGPVFAGRGSQNLYGFGFGARGGYTFPFHVYAGAKFLYYLGHSEDYPAGSASVKIWTLVAEGGYQFEWDAIRLRPYFGPGIAHASASSPTASDSTSYFALQPGATFEYSFSGPAPGPFVGADMHFSLAATGDKAQGIVFLATGGYRWAGL